ncbi:unnamed protein product [Penicillium olsonii]|nr:unnamed protein product [Penicillium olsonii]CAG7930340.1 unnamed protein product [Penicillium olsonii]
MVLSLVPGFSRSSPTRPADDTHSRASANTTNRTWKRSLSVTPTYSGTLTEALRNNPFGNTRPRPGVPPTATEQQQQEQDELNAALETLVHIFPDVRIEVFRELLVRFDGLSRTQVCVEELLRHKKKWVSGRWNIQDSEQGEDSQGTSEGPAQHEADWVPPHERFRTSEYKTAVRTALVKEYNGLNNSTIEGVLAEVNFSYERARPILLDLSRRTWRATFNSILPFRRKKDREAHPLMVWHRDMDGELVPGLKETGSQELDAELHALIIAPLLRQRREEQEGKDFRYASDLNEKEAQAVDSLYECECCFADVTFEQIATCSSNTHIICYHCIQRTVSEALFGQGWGKSVDLERSSLKCLAPLSVGTCEGCLHPEIVKQAILLDTAGFETYRKFEDRLSSEVLMKSQLKLIRCPFCSYAEIDPVYHPSSRGVCWRIRRDAGIIPTILMILLILDLVPLLIIPVLVLLILDPATVTAIFSNAIRNLCLKLRPKRFKCANPSCLRTSCMTCQKPWRDLHVCHEPLLLDLRATVEAARTAAVKRTCPRCSLSFVKSSGCNKLTCVCGYSMCYLCRKALSPRLPGSIRRRQAQDGADDPGEPAEGADLSDDEAEEVQGYQHFCEHFRINPGSRCTECTKCNLYQAEDEEAVARRAGEKAEREWRFRQGGAGTVNPASIPSRNINQDLSAGRDKSNRRAPALEWDMQLISGKPWGYWLSDVWSEGRWKLEGQALADWIVERIVVVEDV